MNHRAFTITLDESGESFPCREDETVLASLYRLGRKGIPLGCRGGGCGVCKVQVTAGPYRKLVMSRGHVTVEDEADGKVLACRIFPEGDLRLRVIGKIEKAFR